MKILISGIFDIIHPGHIHVFKKAKSLGDELIVNVVPDNRAREVKGLNRPIVCQTDRVKVVEGIKYVDYVIVTLAEHKMTYLEYLEKVLKEIKPDRFVFKSFDLLLSKLCYNLDIRFVVIAEHKDYHSTDIINKIKKLH